MKDGGREASGWAALSRRWESEPSDLRALPNRGRPGGRPASTKLAALLPGTHERGSARDRLLMLALLVVEPPVRRQPTRNQLVWEWCESEAEVCEDL